MINELLPDKPTRFLIPGILLVGLLWLSYLVLREFLQTIAWALIVAYVMWPAYLRLRRRLGRRNTLSAVVMSCCISAAILLVLYGLVDVLQEELRTMYQTVANNLQNPSYRLPAFLAEIPWIGPHMQEQLDQFIGDRAGMARQISEWVQQWLGDAAKFIGGVGQYVLKLSVMLVMLFFCFRDGESAVEQLQQGLVRFLGKYQHLYLRAAGYTTRAVVYGLVLAALAQGIVAGLGYAFAGVRAPVMFGAVTALLALVPMGATLVWAPLGLGLIATEHLWQGVGLIMWGVLVVSTVDNVIRPLVISGASRVPFLIVMFGVLGGLSAFGPIGLFLGPVILAVLLAVWQAWIQQQRLEE
ncbi:AI-2E family transporter [Methylomicrobium sp. RS1]|jgi:Ca2+-transporting ATPase|uniref:AI-2E family transporter n=1 Tax=Candidatus Methylomicrobium oryzae TaxID=2802053 RepID=UPI0019242748|nr:AI-2E family transporter [Methylomicrobium sp. RS1]MBL1264464.1 AI-2E family transporter [Methylomicrobium sp. RS1]